MVRKDAENRPQAEGESAVNSAYTGSEAAPLGSVDDHSAQSGIKVFVVLNMPCADLDDECAFVSDKHVCAAYDPSQGYCPFTV